MEFCLVDTETTGLLKDNLPLEHQPKIIEFAAIIVNGATSEVNLIYENLIYPGEEITAEITKITGIKNEDLKGKPTFSEVAGEIAELLKNRVFVAHNAGFDMGMIKNDFARLNLEPPPIKAILCTVEEYSHVFGYRPKLINLYSEIMKEELAQTHRALDDILALHRVLEKDKFYERYIALSGE